MGIPVMHKSSFCVFTVASLALPLAANAAHRTPGLWEGTSTLHFTKGGPQIPPEPLEQTTAHGIDPSKLFGGPHTYKHCLTPEEAAKEEHPQFGGNCTANDATWSGNTFHGAMTCHEGPHESHGTFDATLGDGGESYNGTMHMEGSDPQLGGDYVMEGTFSGKWLGAQCGKEG